MGKEIGSVATVALCGIAANLPFFTWDLATHQRAVRTGPGGTFSPDAVCHGFPSLTEAVAFSLGAGLPALPRTIWWWSLPGWVLRTRVVPANSTTNFRLFALELWWSRGPTSCRNSHEVFRRSSHPQLSWRYRPLHRSHFACCSWEPAERTASRGCHLRFGCWWTHEFVSTQTCRVRRGGLRYLRKISEECGLAGSSSYGRGCKQFCRPGRRSFRRLLLSLQGLLKQLLSQSEVTQRVVTGMRDRVASLETLETRLKALENKGPLGLRPKQLPPLNFSMQIPMAWRLRSKSGWLSWQDEDRASWKICPGGQHRQDGTIEEAEEGEEEDGAPDRCRALHWGCS